jgi:dihydrofolate synthase/folylpolyglutamate synthase
VRSDIVRSEQGVVLSEGAVVKEYQGFPTIRLPENNILIALQAMKMLSDSLSVNCEPIFNYDSIIACLSRVKIEGRLEEVFCPSFNKNQRVFLDVGHNPHAAKYLFGVLKSMKSPGVVVNAVYSSLADKDVASLAEILSPVIDTWFLAPLEDERALDIVKLESAVGAFANNMLSFKNLEEAICSALESQVNINDSQSNSITLVFGSFYVIDVAKAYFEGL